MTFHEWMELVARVFEGLGAVLIRTVLTFSLEVEIEGVVPWRRAATSGLSHVARAAVRTTDGS